MNNSYYLSIRDAIFTYDNPLSLKINKSKALQQEKLINTVLNNSSIGLIVNKSKLKITSITIFSNQLKIKTSEGKEYIEHLNDKTSKIAKKILKITKQHSLTLNRDLLATKLFSTIKTKSTQSQVSHNHTTFYLYSSGGGGHKAAKEALKESNLTKLLEKVKVKCNKGNLNIDPRIKDLTVFTKWCEQLGLISEADVLHDYLGKIGKWASSKWDTAQQKGDVKALERLASKQWLSDLFFGPFIFFATLSSLKEHRPKKIVSTQAMGTPAILLAISIYNKFFKPKEDPGVELHLYATDMSTKESTHFFNSLKTLGKTRKKYLILHAPKPGNNQSWKKLCNLSKKQVIELGVKDLPVRPAFLKAVENQNIDPKNPLVTFKISGLEELNCLNDVLKKQHPELPCLTKEISFKPQILNYPMKQTDKRCFIMLGSNPTESAIKKYVDKFIERAKNNPSETQHLFLFAGKFIEDDPCFYKRLCEYLNTKSENNKWPKNLHIIPLSYQDADQIVNLELQCDTITRSGGSTTMELLILNEASNQLDKPRRWIHVDAIKDRGTDIKDLAKSIPVWEKGNFHFLEEAINAEVIDPEHISLN